MIKLRSKKFCRGISFKLGGSKSSNTIKEAAATIGSAGNNNNSVIINSEVKWELRPGGMLVQKRETGGTDSEGEGAITIRVSTVSKWHEISIEATSTFGELKMVLSLVTGLEPKEQRLLFKGKEREDNEFLHMVGVSDKDKVLLLEDPAIKEMKKLHGLTRGNAYRTISV